MRALQDYRLQATGRRLLKKVARSFYLTICWLPSELQEPVALAYLLARASDTIADEEKHLMTESEQKLVGLFPKLIKELNDPQRNRFDADAIKNVWQKILEGQSMDLQHQQGSIFFSHDALEKYLYLVAGSVGEFLTTLAAYHLPNFSKKSVEKMMVSGIDYGKGLQLVNLLRDFSHDQKCGKFYFSEKEKEYYHVQAETYLQQGEAYVNALHPGYFKVACALPFLLGRKTLVLLKKEPNAEKLKISRWQVYAALLRALQFLIW